MKKLYALPFALIFALPTQAGVWDLFPLGNATYYADSAQQPVSVELYRMDSVLPGAGEDVLYFNKRSRSQMLGDCASTISFPEDYLTGTYPQDSLILRNDSVFFNSEFSTLPFYFLPLAAIGQSWTVTSDYPGNSYGQIIITCTGIEQRSFMGITDSVKIFSMVPNGSSPGQTPISDFQIVLSKEHGLVEFVPFEQFLHHPTSVQFRAMKMIGLNNGLASLGFRRPDLTDYFHLHAEDVLVWEVHFVPDGAGQQETYDYLIDSLTSSINTSDSVLYYGVRTWHYHDGTSESFSMVLSRFRSDQFDNLLNAGTNELATTQSSGSSDVYFPSFTGTEETPEAWMTSNYKISMDDDGVDTICTTGFYSPGNYLYTPYCEIHQAWDFENSFRIDTRVGYNQIIRGTMGTQGTRTWNLIGSVINGVEDGDFTLSVQAPRLITRQAFTLMPNPAKESITFQGLPPGTIGQYAIYDGLGREAMHGALPPTSLSVEGLQPGVYVVQVHLSDRIEMARFVKE